MRGNRQFLLYDYQILMMQKYGGISRYFYEVVSRVPETEFQVQLPVTHNLNFYFQDYFHKPIREIKSIRKYNRIIKRNQAYIKFILGRNKENICFHPTYYNPYFLDALKGKLVVTVHDMIHENYSEYYAGNATIGHKKILMDRADKIIAVSETTKRDILKLYPEMKEDKIKVIYHGCEKETSLIKDSHYEVKYIGNGNRKFLLYVGNRDRYKNFLRFAQAITRVMKDNEQIWLVCVGGGEFRPEEKVIFEEGCCQERVIQVDAEERELLWLYQNAACFIFPSKAEGFGIPILEAWKNNCPIAMSRIECFQEIGGDAALYFDPDDVSDIEKKVLELIYGEISGELLRKGKERIKRFSWDMCAEKHLQVYREMSS